MAIPRGKPYIWATWLSRVMTGHVSCQWQYWFLAWHKLIQEQSATFDSVGWQIRHTRLLTEVRQELTAAGVRANTELAFQCQVPGCDVLINGKIDCLAVDGRNVTVYDCKTGKPRSSDRAQVMIYMYALSTYPRFVGSVIRGMVVYQDRRDEIPCLPEDFADQLAYFTRLLVRMVLRSGSRAVTAGSARSPATIVRTAGMERMPRGDSMNWRNDND